MILTLVGLVMDIVGTVLLASLLFVSKKKAKLLSATVYGENPHENQDRLQQSKKAKWGAILIIIGFILQIIGVLHQAGGKIPR